MTPWHVNKLKEICHMPVTYSTQLRWSQYVQSSALNWRLSNHASGVGPSGYHSIHCVSDSLNASVSYDVADCQASAKQCSYSETAGSCVNKTCFADISIWQCLRTGAAMKSDSNRPFSGENCCTIRATVHGKYTPITGTLKWCTK